MNKYSTLFFLSLLFVSCTSNTILKKPENLIPKEQMVNLITDLFIANEAKSIKNENLERKINYVPLIFEKYQIDSLRFKESNMYYTSKIDDYNDILAKVDKRLKLLLAQLKKDVEIKDSIERATRFSKSKKKEEAFSKKKLKNQFSHPPLKYDIFQAESLNFKVSNLYYKFKIEKYFDTLNEVKKQVKPFMPKSIKENIILK